MRDRRVQYLPVQWRTVLKLDIDEETRRKDAGLDNEFTLDGIWSHIPRACYISKIADKI